MSEKRVRATPVAAAAEAKTFVPADKYGQVMIARGERMRPCQEADLPYFEAQGWVRIEAGKAPGIA